MVINSCNYSCYIYSVCHKKCTENLAKFKQLEPRQFKVEANSKKRDLGVDHLTFEGGGGGGRIDLYKIFLFSLASGAGNFFRAVHAFFYYHSCCMIFLTVKA